LQVKRKASAVSIWHQRSASVCSTIGTRTRENFDRKRLRVPS